MRRLMAVCLVCLAVAGARPATADEVKLRKWHFGLQGVTTRRDNYDVFGVFAVPPDVVEDRGRGTGLLIGYRFGTRFLLGLQMAYGRHAIVDSPQEMVDVEALLTGTVLFRETALVQPFLRGGFGGGGVILQLNPDGGDLTAFGTSAIAGGGLQLRLSSRFSLELEAVATFTNFLEVQDNSTARVYEGKSWQVRESNVGSRVGVGVVVWF